MTAFFTVVLVTTLGTTPNCSNIPHSAQILGANVRLAVADGNGVGYGTGTIVDVPGAQLLVDAPRARFLIVTCAHIFEHAQLGAPVTVIRLSPGDEDERPGRVISFDKDNDVALVLAEGPPAADPIRLASPQYKPQPGDRVVVAGCEGGQQSIELTSIVAVDRFAGAANVEVAAMPPDGRSGGGLFTESGELCGVCNGREPIRAQGVYAALSCVLAELRKNKITSVEDCAAHSAAGEPATARYRSATG